MGEREREERERGREGERERGREGKREGEGEGERGGEGEEEGEEEGEGWDGMEGRLTHQPALGGQTTSLVPAPAAPVYRTETPAAPCSP